MTTAMPPLSTPLPADVEPAWEVATLFPAQGHWSEGEYLRLTATTNRLIEFVDGRIEFVPMPTLLHQLIMQYFFKLLDGLDAGIPVMSGLKARLRTGNFRQPDVLFLLNEHTAYAENEFWRKVDLALEVVSPDDPNRDYVKKRQDYAEAGITEYWIADAEKQQVLILTLADGQYVEYGRHGPGDVAVSKLLPQLSMSVDRLLAGGRDGRKA